MTAQASAHRAARPRRSLRGLRNRMSLRAKLITGLLALVIAAVAAISVSSVWVLHSYLTSQDDAQLQSMLRGFYANVVNGTQVFVPGDLSGARHQ